MEFQKKIIQVLDEIRPFLQRDGGDIRLVDIQGRKVIVSFTGYCSVCNKSPMTFSAIRSLLMEKVPEIEDIVEHTGT